MVKLFDINDPFRLIIVIVLALITKIVVMLNGVAITSPELYNLILGEQLAEGYMLYRDLEDHQGLFSNLIFSGISTVFGHSHSVLHIIGFILVLFQAIFFNLIINGFDILKEKSYLPAFFYSLLSFLYVDISAASPTLFAVTISLVAIYYLLSLIKNGNTDDGVFKTGFYLGIACLCMIHSIFFSFMILMTFLLYTGTMPRRYVILFFGFLFPFLMAFLFFYWHNSPTSFLLGNFGYPFILDKIEYLSVNTIFRILIVPFSLAVFGVLISYNGLGFVNFQIKCHRIFLLWLLIGIVIVFTVRDLNSSVIIYFLAPISFFISLLIQKIRKKWMKEMVMYITILSTIIPLMSYYKPMLQSYYQVADNYFVTSKEIPAEGTILVLSPDISYYEGRKMATPFLNWRIVSSRFIQPDSYERVNFIYNYLSKDMPDIIVDPLHLMPVLQKRILFLETNYSITKEGYYIRVNQ